MGKKKDRRSMEFPAAEDRGMRRETLIEYDGPRLVLFRSKGLDRLGIVLEPGVELERWFLSRPTPMELESLAHGTLPMRDIFTDRPLRALDIDVSGAVRGAWDAQEGDVPAGLLPLRGALLPVASRPRLLKLLRFA